MQTLEIYRSKGNGSEGRWFVVTARNKNGAVHSRADITELMEERFQAELGQHLRAQEKVWEKKLERETAHCRNLHDRLTKVLADKEAEITAAVRLLEQKEDLWDRNTLERLENSAKAWQEKVYKRDEVIRQLQAEVRDKVSEIKKLNDATRNLRERADRIFSPGQWSDEEALHEARRSWKLSHGRVPFEKLPWYRRLFKRPDEDLYLYPWTTDEHKDLCRTTYASLLAILRERLGF